MRLIFATSTPTNVQGGSGTFVGISVLAAALRRAGHDVRLVAPGFRHSPLGHTLKRLRFNLVLGRRVAIHCPDAAVGFDLDGFLLSRPTPYPFAVSIKGVLADELTFERGFTRRLLAFQSLCEHANVRGDVPVLATSDYAARRIGQHYGVPAGRRHIVPEPIDLDRWQAALSATAAVPTGDTILTVCHLYPRKRVGVLIAAMPRILRHRPDARLRIVGVGPEFGRLRAQVAALGLRESVELLGHIPFAQLCAEYRRAAIFCLPSVQEGFGIVLLEAMAAGLPIVACQAAAVPEVAPDGEVGRLVPPDDPAALAAALVELLERPERRKALGQAGQERVQRYRADAVAADFLAAIGPSSSTAR